MPAQALEGAAQELRLSGPAQVQQEVAQAWPLPEVRQAEDLQAEDLVKVAHPFRQPRASPRHRR